MNKSINTALTFLAACAVFFVIFPFAATAQGGEVIERFDVTVEVQSDGSLDVVEKIQYDLGGNERRGIYREIPSSYEENGEKYKLILSDFTVTSATAPSEVDIDRAGGLYRLQIGDGDREITGMHTYTVSYTAENAIAFYEDFDEVYWNATGRDWEVPIRNASLTIFMPEVFAEDELRVACYQGRASSASCEDTTFISNVGDIEGVQAVHFRASNLSVDEELTAALGFPKGVVPEIEREIVGLSGEILRIIAFTVTGLVGIAVVWAAVHWYRHGRDPRGRGTVVRQYNAPEGLSPAEVGLILDEDINNHDITAEIVYLAEQGYLHVLSIPKKILFFNGANFYLLKMREADESLKEHQRIILKHLFSASYVLNSSEKNELEKGVGENDEVEGDKGEIVQKIKTSLAVTPLEDLQGDFYANIKSIKSALYKTMAEEGYFTEDPQKVRNKYGSLSLLIFGVSLILFLIFTPSHPGAAASAVVGLFFGLIAVSFYASAMVQKTERGVAAREHALGLKEYLSIAEKDRLEFHFNPRNNPEIFEELLPYAIALKVDKQWANGLEDLYVQPDWYTDAGNQHFTVGAFYSSFSGFDTATASSYSPPSSSGSSGGGFSGGGAGGGGGGSW